VAPTAFVSQTVNATIVRTQATGTQGSVRERHALESNNSPIAKL
jgi:hypothetical protein